MIIKSEDNCEQPGSLFILHQSELKTQNRPLHESKIFVNLKMNLNPPLSLGLQIGTTRTMFWKEIWYYLSKLKVCVIDISFLGVYFTEILTQKHKSRPIRSSF